MSSLCDFNSTYYVSLCSQETNMQNIEICTDSEYLPIIVLRYIRTAILNLFDSKAPHWAQNYSMASWHWIRIKNKDF